MRYVLAGYGITVFTLAAYAFRVVRRERALARTLQRPEDNRQWR